ncbi:MAG TPA: hypothetical protein PLZ99_02760 [Parcubacteria group bacterium]|jgi:hypothetical protein|nr:hypothetical protein [Parcubacteria group bacterium]
MQDYLALVRWTVTSQLTGKILATDSDCFDFKAENHDDAKSKIKSLEREEFNPPRSKTVYKVVRIWKVEEISLD